MKTNKALLGMLALGAVIGGIFWARKAQAANTFKVGDHISLISTGGQVFAVLAVYPDMTFPDISSKGAYLVEVIANGAIGTQVYLDFTSASTRFQKVA